MIIKYEARYKRNNINVYKMYFKEGEKGESDWSIGGYGSHGTCDKPDVFIKEELIFSRSIEFITLADDNDKLKNEVIFKNVQGLCSEADDEILKICVDILIDKSLINNDDIAKSVFKSYTPYNDKKTSITFDNQLKINNLLYIKDIEKYGNIVEYLFKKGKLAYEHEIYLEFIHIIRCYLNDNYKLLKGYKFYISNTFDTGYFNDDEIKIHNLSYTSMYNYIDIQVVSPAGVDLNEKEPKAIYEKRIHLKQYHNTKIGFMIDFKQIDEVMSNEMPQIIKACKEFNTYGFMAKTHRFKKPVYKFNNHVRKLGLNKDSMDLIKNSHKYIDDLLKKNNCIAVDYTFYNEIYHPKENKVYAKDYSEGISITVEFEILTSEKDGLRVKRKSFELDKIVTSSSYWIGMSIYKQSSKLDEFIEQEILPICNEFKRDLYKENSAINPNNYIYKRVNEDFYRFLCERYLDKNTNCLTNESEIEQALKVRNEYIKIIDLDKEKRLEIEKERLYEVQKRLDEELRIKEEAKLQDKNIINKLLRLFGKK